MYNANDAFATQFVTLMQATRIHANSNDFGARLTARDEMDAAERKIAYAKRHPTFDIDVASRIAMDLKCHAA